MLTLNTLILAGRLSFAENGKTETISSTPHTVSELYAPDPATSALFLSLGNFPGIDINPKLGKVDVRGPVPGGYGYGKRKSIVTSNDMEIQAKATDWNEQFIRAVFMLPELPVIGDTAYTPLSQSSPITGWLFIDLGDAAVGQVVKGRVYGELSVQKLPVAEKMFEHTMVFEVIPNSLGTLNLAALLPS